MEAIACSQLSQRYGAQWVLSRLDFSLTQGSRLLLTGENGAGKTTLLRILATALRPSRGQLQLFGQSIWPHGRAARSRLALMTHQHYLYEALSARENLYLVQRLAGPRAQGDIAALLDRVGLGRVGEAAVHTFSAGMKRRLALARVLLLKPELVLFDEPFAQLDPEGQALIARLITQMADAGTTMVIASHDIERTKLLCTHHLHLHTQGPAPKVVPLQAQEAL